MEITYEELSKKTVAELREIASNINHPAVQGYTQLNKRHLLPKICEALEIETHEHHEVIGVNKTKIKSEIRKLKKQRDVILSGPGREGLTEVREKIHELKRRLRQAIV